MLRVAVILMVSWVVLGAPNSKHPIPTDVRIIGGEDADIANFPWHISVQHSNQHFCGGFLISSTWAATAGHCIYDIYSKNITIRAGTSNRVTGGQIVNIKRSIVHPSYRDASLDYDIALLQLASPVTIANARPAVLPIAGEAVPVGATLTVTGWGVTAEKNEPYSINLKQVSVPTLSQADCQRAYPSLITDEMFCAGLVGTGGKDACTGDSGGPAVINGKVVGIISWGKGCAEPNNPGVYAKVSTFRDWIKKVAGI